MCMCMCKLALYMQYVYIEQASLRHRRIIKLAFVLAFWLLLELLFILNWTSLVDSLFVGRQLESEAAG